MADRALDVDAATDVMASTMGAEKAIRVVERALLEDSPSDLGRQSLERVLARLRAREIPQRETVEA